MVEYTGEITEAQWAKIEPLLPTPLVHPTGAVLAFLIAQYSRGFYGSYAVALAGGIYRADTLLPAPVGVGCKNGKKPKYGSALGGLF